MISTVTYRVSGGNAVSEHNRIRGVDVVVCLFCCFVFFLVEESGEMRMEECEKTAKWGYEVRVEETRQDK